MRAFYLQWYGSAIQKPAKPGGQVAIFLGRHVALPLPAHMMVDASVCFDEALDALLVELIEFVDAVRILNCSAAHAASPLHKTGKTPNRRRCCCRRQGTAAWAAGCDRRRLRCALDCCGVSTSGKYKLRQSVRTLLLTARSWRTSSQAKRRCTGAYQRCHY